MASHLILSVSSLMGELDGLEAQGHGDAVLELCAMIPIVTRKLVLPITALRERLEGLEAQGYGESFLELGSITFNWGKVRLYPGEDLCQISATAHLQPVGNEGRKAGGFQLIQKLRHWLKGPERSRSLGEVPASVNASNPHYGLLPKPIEVELPPQLRSPAKGNAPVQR